MKNWRVLPIRIFATNIGLCVMLIASLSLSACGNKKIVPDYEASSYDEIQRLAGEVDNFYAGLLAVAAQDRQFQQFSEQYSTLETQLTSFYNKNQSRSDNIESTKISQSILGLWKKYKIKHQSDNDYTDGNVTLDRNRFVRLFASAGSAEKVKKRN